MKFKITGKLIAFFLTALLISTAVTGALFCVLIARHTTQIYKSDLIHRAKVLSKMLSHIYENSKDKERPNLSALRGLHEIVGAELWLVNEDYSVITIRGPGIPPRRPGERKSARAPRTDDVRGRTDAHGFDETSAMDESARPPVPEKDGISPEPPSQKWPPVKEKSADSKLPPGADEVLRKAFSGETLVTEVFNPVLETKSLTAGAPVYKRGTDSVQGVLLLHSPVLGLNEAIFESIKILAWSAATALLIGVIAAVVLSMQFTKPLRQMNDAAKELAKKNYTITTGVRQKNELGELAETLDTLAVQLKNASEESERLEKMRRDFFANVSHELRTPVTVLRGSLEALIDGVITEPREVLEYNQQMLGETVHLQRLVNDLLELSRLQTVDFKIEKNDFNVVQAAEEAGRAMQKAAAEKGVEITIEKNCEQKIVSGDYGRVRQMLMTILDNAIKFSANDFAAGGNGLASSSESGRNATTVTMLIKENEISITDHGSGISAEDLPHIFERFKKERSAANKSGTGLGLAIAKEIALRHGWTLFAESPVFGDAANPGARFTCRFSHL